VETWLASAERIELPEDGSLEGALAESVKYVVEYLPEGAEVKDLDDGKALIVGKRKVFKTNAVVRQVAARFDKPKVKDVTLALKKMGLKNKTYRYGPGTKDTVKVWFAPHSQFARSGVGSQGTAASQQQAQQMVSAPWPIAASVTEAQPAAEEPSPPPEQVTQPDNPNVGDFDAEAA
jgi:hypothetical protein